MTPEGKIAAYLKKRVNILGGVTRKVSFPGHRGAPDLLVWVPQWDFPCLIETKDKTGKLTTLQHRECNRLRRMGLDVFVVRSESDINKILPPRR